MRNASRSIMLGLLLCGVLALAPTSWAQQRAPLLDQVAKTYGIDSWDKVEAIRYTWNGEITGLFKAAHKWEWEPKTGKVTFEGTDKDGKPVNVSYVRTDLSTQSDAVKNQIERVTRGVAQKKMSLARFKTVAVPLPPLAEQTRIVAEVERRLSVVEELESVVTANLQRASSLRQSILQKAFTGELV